MFEEDVVLKLWTFLQQELLYEGDYDEIFRNIITCIHELLEHSWGQRVIRFYDPDMHIIEVAEEISVVLRRFCDSGMNEEEIAVRMDVPIDYIQKYLPKYT